MSVSFCLPHPAAVSAFMICRSLCACTEMLWMCVLYVSFGSKVICHLYYTYVSTMCIYCDYCVYHYKSTELVSLYTLDIGL